MTTYAAAVRELTATLRQRTADRPAHAAYLDALLTAPDGAELDDVPRPAGVSPRIAAALIDDVEWLREPAPPTEDHRHAYPRAYHQRRHADARTAADRERTRRSLTTLLPR